MRSMLSIIKLKAQLKMLVSVCVRLRISLLITSRA